MGKRTDDEPPRIDIRPLDRTSWRKFLRLADGRPRGEFARDLLLAAIRAQAKKKV